MANLLLDKQSQLDRNLEEKDYRVIEINGKRYLIKPETPEDNSSKFSHYSDSRAIEL